MKILYKQDFHVSFLNLNNPQPSIKEEREQDTYLPTTLRLELDRIRRDNSYKF